MSFVFSEKDKQFIFLRFQGQRIAVQGYFAARDADNKFIEGEGFVFDDGLCRFLHFLARQTRAPYLCFYARHQFAHREWFGEIVICTRSEEHTSELQSQSNLVCRLLLEKK